MIGESEDNLLTLTFQDALGVNAPSAIMTVIGRYTLPVMDTNIWNNISIITIGHIVIYPNEMKLNIITLIKDMYINAIHIQLEGTVKKKSKFLL